MLRLDMRRHRLDGGAEYRRVVRQADPCQIFRHQMVRQHEIDNGADQHAFYIKRSVVVERAVMRGQQLLEKRQTRGLAQNLAPEFAPQRLLVADHAARQRGKILPRSRLLPEPHFPRTSAVSTGELVHRLGERDVLVGHAARVMGRQCHLDGFVNVEPFGVMIHLFGNQRRPGHEAEGGVEIGENEFFADGIAILRLAPAFQPAERRLTCLAGKLAAHSRLHRCPGRLAPRRLPLSQICGQITSYQDVLGTRLSGRAVMGWSLKIGSVAGTAVRIHVTFLLFLVWIFGVNYAAGGQQAAWGGLLFMVLLFGCVLLHEFGHIFTARGFGVTTPDVILLPIGGVARLERIPEEPWEEFLIAIAGPAVNVVIAALLVFVGGAHLNLDRLTTLDIAGGGLIDRLAAVNLFLAVFNLIPAFPMDGVRVLRALLATRLGDVPATEIAAMIGQGVAFLLGFLGLFGNPLLIFIAIFVYLAASSEAHLVAIRAVSRGVPVTAAMMTQFATLTPDEHIDAAVETLLRTSQGEFPVIDAASRPVGVLGRTDLIRALKERGPDARVADAMAAPLPTVGNRSCLDEAFRILQEKRMPAVGVVDMSGRLAGLVTSETVGEMLMLHRAMPSGLTFGPWGRRPAGA